MNKITRKVAGHGSKLLVTILATFLFSACEDNNCIKGEGSVETRTLNLQSFSKVEANGDFKVYLTQGQTQKVEVRGEPNILDQLNTSISNSTWEIENRDCVRKSKAVEVYITMPSVQSLSLNGSGHIRSQDAFEADEVLVEVNGSGEIEVGVNAAKVMTRVTGSGRVALRGQTDLHHINMSGSGKAAAFELLAEDVTVNLSGSGMAEVSANQSLTADITGSGVVYYQGNPTVNTNISGSGKVVKR